MGAIRTGRTVYAVSSGCYSDYRVEALFEDEKDAEAFRMAGGGDEVEEFPYHAAGAKVVRVYRAYWKDDLYVTVTAYVDDGEGTIAKHYSRPVIDEPDEPWMGSRFEACCTNEEAAKKSVIDRQTALEARRM
jgi:hypothetical protein